MHKKRSMHTLPRPELAKKKVAAEETLKNRQDVCNNSESSSHTQVFKRKNYQKEYKRITSDEYCGKSESISGSSDTFHCVHGPEGKKYTTEGQLKRNLIKELDPIKIPRIWTENCPPSYGWEVAETLEFLVTDPVGQRQTDRIETYIRDFSITAQYGYVSFKYSAKIEILKSLEVVLDFLVENLKQRPNFREGLMLLLKITEKPILLNLASDVVSHFSVLTSYIGFLGYLLIRLEEDELFDIVARGLIWQLSAKEAQRGSGAAPRRHVLGAASTLLQTTTKMLALASSHRFPAFLQIAVLLASSSEYYCVDMIKENIIENIFYRFNPYFPIGDLPAYENNPANPQDYNIKLGDCSINMPTVLSLLLVVLQTLMNCLNVNPDSHVQLPCPDHYAQRCFIWAYRFECRARARQHERNTLTVVAHALLHCFGDRLTAFSTLLMPDIMTLSILTEIPRRHDWTRTVNFNTSQADVHFKKVLIYLSVDFLKTIPVNTFMVESQYWLLGLMFLLDPCLSPLRAHWSPALFFELRKTALQALVSTLPIMPPRLIQEYDIIRRVLWYIEWYAESPYDLSTLYWCVRTLRAATHDHLAVRRQDSFNDLFNTHGIIILIHLCYILLEQKCPPVEKSQAIISLILRVLTSAVEINTKLTCCVYPPLNWPGSVCTLAHRMMNIVLYALGKHFIVTDRWLISLLNFIWEAVVWNKEYRQKFIVKNGVYNLLDIISVSKAPVQCLALAVLNDIARSGNAVAQLVTWRAGVLTSYHDPCVVKRGSSIACLLAAVFRDECLSSGIHLDGNGVIQNMDNPLQSSQLCEEVNNVEHTKNKSPRSPVCVPAADIAGSRASKVFAILQLLSEDLADKVALADETYNLYKNIRLSPEDEVILVLCSHYLTIKLSETWKETKIKSPTLTAQDEVILTEFMELNTGWAREIKQQQLDVLKTYHKEEVDDENSLYEFLQRVRLNVALDALREVRCAARSARTTLRTAQRSTLLGLIPRSSLDAEASPLRTYRPPLDDQNITGQYVKLYSIQSKNKCDPKNTSSQK